MANIIFGIVPLSSTPRLFANETAVFQFILYKTRTHSSAKMAWRPKRTYLLAGELDNTTPGKVTGWMEFLGLDKKIIFDLDGEFHRDIRRAKIRLHGIGYGKYEIPEARNYFRLFATQQTGVVGDITAGLPPYDYANYPYIEWYGSENGRVLLELDPSQVRVIGMPIPYIESDPISRKQQEDLLKDFLKRIADDFKKKREK